MKKSVGTILLLAAATGGILFGLRWCSPPPPPPPPGDYSKAGNDGGQKPAAVDRETTLTVNPRGNSFTDDTLSTLVCGTPYKMSAIASERVANCENMDYARLRDIAYYAIENRVARLRCPADCGPLSHARGTYVKFECRGHRRTVSLKKEIICARPGDAVETAFVSPLSLHAYHSTETAVAGEDGDMTPPARRGELITDLTAGATETSLLRCGQTLTFSTEYAETEPGQCASFSDYSPYVARAEARAASIYHSPVSCPAGCTKQAVSFKRREWSCDAVASNVIVKLWFTVECK